MRPILVVFAVLALSVGAAMTVAVWASVGDAPWESVSSTATPTTQPTPKPTAVRDERTSTEAQGDARRWLIDHNRTGEVYEGTILDARGCDLKEYNDSTDEWIIECEINYRHLTAPTPPPLKDLRKVGAPWQLWPSIRSPVEFVSSTE